ncbi:MAG: MFS transporter [Bacteroidales bacterium]|nr:MFS transporter [Bacteroidales bacterium]MCF8343953.1 MFS transporter [Bacteroidales bacterium]MCF8351195.1 MFS transporter [Bacteroidales bacterium]MCF8375324.1 MFS transporter [Bacteroidales bacterium]MCF8400180.1 MFS transporter [Bacteroidales bacterium]
MILKGTPNRGLIGATLGFFIGFAAVSLFGPTAKVFDQYMNMSNLQLGLLVAMAQLSGSLLRIPFGAWVDTTGGKKPFTILLLFSAIGMAGLTLLLYTTGQENLNMDHYPLLLILALFIGSGVATFSVGIGQVSYWFPQKKQGWALGAYAGFGNIAPGLFALLIPLLIGTLMLTGTYLVWLLFLIVGIIIYVSITPNAFYFQIRKKSQEISGEEARQIAKENGQEIFPSGGAWSGLKKAARIWQTWPLVLLYFTTFGGFLALTVWFPTYWNEYFDKDLKTAGAFTMLFSVLASIIRVPGGIISDKIGGIKTIFISVNILLLGAILLTFSVNLLMAVTGLLLMAIGMGVNNAGVFKLVPHYVKEAVGGAAGIVGGLGAFGGFVIPPLMGLFVDMQGIKGYSNGFIIFIVLAIVSFVCALYLHRSERN